MHTRHFEQSKPTLSLSDSLPRGGRLRSKESPAGFFHLFTTEIGAFLGGIRGFLSGGSKVGDL